MITNPEWEKAQRGELYHAFIPELIAARDLCKEATNRFNASTDLTRRRQVELWRATFPIDPSSDVAAPLEQGATQGAETVMRNAAEK
ncbi:hypothetical protein EDD37DRAFT_644328 [Exophiala viscosa]|uniref:uncharacterized protein n=1 Tax=Exophiala viscosa TaxID=2486360 RepID=UPI0021A0B02A|nr:hypothetical protein EDD37DRAFT_644328 [Exophiala viscosa]